jgi:hypothetical protein
MMFTRKDLLAVFCLCLFLATNTLKGQDSSNKERKLQKWALGSVQVGFGLGSFYTLNKAWYSNYPRTNFHFYNDWKEWQQMDKIGHSWSAFQLSRLSSNLWEAAGTPKSKAAWIGSLSSMGYMSIIVILDGYSDKWGFSAYDILSNTVGASAFLIQELKWKEERLLLKLSYFPVQYGTLSPRADDLFGKSGIEKLLKDYNGQTYWASLNIRSFLPESQAPQWLNLAIGYGAKTMLGGYENRWTDNNGQPIVRPDIVRYKRFYLSLDIDLNRIKTKNRTLKTILSAANVLKIPAPALELNSQGRVRFHPLFY